MVTDRVTCGRVELFLLGIVQTCESAFKLWQARVSVLWTATEWTASECDAQVCQPLPAGSARGFCTYFIADIRHILWSQLWVVSVWIC